MAQTYQLRKATHSDLGFYRNCLLDESWKNSYGAFNRETSVDDYLVQLALTEYPSVSRFMVLKNSIPIAFFHIQCSAAFHKCTLAGGVDAANMGRGYGLKVAVIALDFIFSNLGYHKINCKVLERNQASRKMLSGLGFVQEGIAREHEYDHVAGKPLNAYFFGLLRREYPNKLAKDILKRISYEQV